jgi:hypothetical protein
VRKAQMPGFDDVHPEAVVSVEAKYHPHNFFRFEQSLGEFGRPG